MALVIDNDAIKFLEGFKVLCDKYVKSTSLMKMDFNDGTSIGMGLVIRYGLGHISLQQCISGI